MDFFFEPHCQAMFWSLVDIASFLLLAFLAVMWWLGRLDLSRRSKSRLPKDT